MKICINCQTEIQTEGWLCGECGFEPQKKSGVVIFAPRLETTDIGFDSRHFDELVKQESEHFWFKARNLLISWALSTADIEHQNFLEVGCGNGFVLKGLSFAYPEIELSGTEIFYEGIINAKKRLPGACFMQMDARNIPFENEFDAVGAFDVVEHIKEDEIVLSQLHKSLKEGGTLLISAPQHPFLWSSADEYAQHVRRYTKFELENKVIAAGFRISRSFSFITFLFPLMYLSRLVKKYNIHKKHDVYSELRINNTINAIFYAITKFELYITKLGINLPFGGTRFIVAKKK